MKHHQLFAAFILSVWVLAGCKKTTTVSGVITDSGTGLPIKGVQVLLVANKIGNKGMINVDNQTDLTDDQGQYLVEVEGKKINHVFMRITKKGYAAPKIIYFENGDCTEFNRQLNPFDANLQLTLINESGAEEFYYYTTGALYEGSAYQDTPYGDGPYIIPPQSSLIHDLDAAGGGFVRIVWDYQRINLESHPHIDSVYCARNDTTYYELKY